MCQAFQTNPIQSLIDCGNLRGHRTCFCGERKNVPFTRTVAKRTWFFRSNGKKCEMWKQSCSRSNGENYGNTLTQRTKSSSNANNFNLAIDDENIDFNISGVPNSIVKRSHGINVHNLFSRSRITLNDKHFKVIFNNIKHSIPSTKNQKMWSWLLGWTMPNSRCGARSTVQSMPDVLERWHRILHMRALLARWHNRKHEIYLVRIRSLRYPELLHQEGPATRSQVREERRLQRTLQNNFKRGVERNATRKHSRSIYPWQVVQKNDEWVGSLWRDHSWNGSTSKWRPQSYCHRRENWCISWQLVDPFEFGGFRHDVEKASTWLQESVVNLASLQESRGSNVPPKLFAKLFLLVVAMANFLVASSLETSPHRWTWHWLNGETWEVSETSF